MNMMQAGRCVDAGDVQPETLHSDPWKHVGSTVVFDWKVGGCNMNVEGGCDEPQASEQVHYHSVF